MRARIAIASTSLIFTLACGNKETVPLGSRLAIDSLADFGDVPVGHQGTVTIALRNLSNEKLDLEGVQRAENFEGNNYTFRVVDFPDSIEALGTAMLTVIFEPYAETAETIESSFAVVTDFGLASVAVRGRGVQAFTITPTRLDFGRVVRGESKTLTVKVTNYLPQVMTVERVRPIERVDGNGEFATNTIQDVLLTVAQNEEGEFAITYTPSRSLTSVGSDRARLTVRTCSLPICEVVIDLEGRGSDEALICDPASVDFGAVEENESGVATVTCTAGPAAVNIESVEVTGRGELDVEAAPERRLPASVEPGAQFNFTIVWRPRESTDLSVRVRISGRQPSTGRSITPVDVMVTGVRGSPRIQVTPPSLDFGSVALGTRSELSLRIRSAGSRPLTISSITIDSRWFSTSDSGMHSIPPGDFVDVVVQFEPERAQRYTSEVTIATDDPVTPTAHIPITGEGLDLAPCQYQTGPFDLSFGLVEPLRERRAALTITNVGQEDCLLSNFQVEGAAMTMFAIESSPAGETRLGPGLSVELGLLYRPTTLATHDAELTFYVSDPAAPVGRVNLHGVGGQDLPIVYPDELDFGGYILGCTSETRTVRIHNGRINSMTIFGAELVGSSNFTLGVLNYPLVMPPNTGTEFSITYHPTLPQKDHAELVITEASSSEVYKVWLSGSGGGGMQTETFIQADDPEVDVLMVIDSSCSLGEEQTTMAANFSAFIGPADNLNIDYQIAVVDTSYDDCVRVLQRPNSYDDGMCGYFSDGMLNDPALKIVTRNEPLGPHDAWAELINVGFNGSGFEQPLANARSALRAPINLGWNAGFIRPNASLAVIFMSDEIDGSPGPVALYTDDVLGIHGSRRKNDTSMHAITGDPLTGCNGPGGSADVGDRLVEGTLRGGGTFQSVCAPDWVATMEAIGLEVFGYRSRFVLESVPVAPLIEVSVDGVIVPATGPSGEVFWRYDAATNSINFALLALPEAGAEIDIAYDKQCN